MAAFTLETAEHLVREAATPAALFPEGEADRKLYRELAAALHPDRYRVPTEHARAAASFVRLSEMWAQRRDPLPRRTMVIGTKRRSYVMDVHPDFRGGVANLYRGAFNEDETEFPVMMKMVRRPVHARRLEREAALLRELMTETAEPTLRNFVPELIETFRHRHKASGVDRRVNVLSVPAGFFNLVEVRDVYPNGVDPRDAAWIWRRLLTAVGFAHVHGYVHGAITPEHVLIHPEMHGLVVCGWGASVTTGREVEVLGRSRWRDLYPPETEFTEASDIFMTSKTMAYLCGERMPMPYHAFVRGCTLERERSRPHDCLALREELEELIYRMFGPRRFHPFWMPAR